MPSRHSKNSGDKHHFTYHEKVKAGLGSVTQRLGTESQLPFGYCCLSMHPAEEAVVSPSGHIYSREFILEYLLTKSKELKKASKAFEDQQAAVQQTSQDLTDEKHSKLLKDFTDTQDGVNGVVKRKFTNDSSNSESISSYQQSRKKVIDDTDNQEKLAQLRKVSPWVPQFTPEAKESDIKEPPKRPPSPYSGRPLRSKDLIPINLIKEQSSSSSAETTRYICPVSRKTITNQKVILIKTTGAIMLEQTAKDLAYPSMTCPITGKPFQVGDVLDFAQSASGFAATGEVEAKVHRPTLN